MGSAGRTLAGASCGGKIGGPTDMSAKHRALLATQQKLKDAGLNPDSASKHSLGGKLSIKPDKGCNDEHFDRIRDQKNFANAAAARAGGWRVVKGHKSKKTGIQSWRLIPT
jgi:hypothetical protein